MQNKYAGACRKCKTHVDVGQGVYHDAVYCKSCVTSGDLPAPVQRAATLARPSVRELTSTGEVRTPYEPDNLTLFRAFPGARWNKEQRCWSVSLADADLPRVLELADTLKLTVPPEIRTRATTRTEQAALVASDPRLYPFQVKGVDFLSRRKNALLADQMGLGKTVQALCALGEGWRVLVICPASLKFNWRNEARKWAKHYRVTILEGRSNWKWPEQGEIVISNYSILPSYLKHDLRKVKQDPKKQVEAMAIEAALLEIPNGISLIVDEAHNVKSNKAERSRATRQLAIRADRVWALTGTPLLTRAMDLWGILNNLNLAKEVFSWPIFTKLFNGRKNRWGGWEFSLPGPEVAERLRRVMLRRLRDEVLPDLPDKLIKTVEVDGIGKGLERELDELWGEFQEQIEGGSLPPFERFSEIRAKLAESRIPALEEIVEDYEEEGVPLVVFSAHRAPVDHLSLRDGWRTITGDTPPHQRQLTVDAFQAGSLKGVALTIAAGGVGITLTKASHEIFTDLDWTPALNQQAEDRCARIGQTAQKINITRLVSKHPLDIHVSNLIAEKIALIDASIEAKAEVVIPEQAATAEAPQSHVSKVESDDLLNALRILSGICDGARELDDVGFNRTDSAFGKSLAARSYLTDRQAEAVKRMLRKYHRQLPADLYARLYPEVVEKAKKS